MAEIKDLIPDIPDLSDLDFNIGVHLLTSLIDANPKNKVEYGLKFNFIRISDYVLMDYEKWQNSNSRLLSRAY